MIHSRYTKALVGIFVVDLFATLYTLFLVRGVLSYYGYLPFGYPFVASVIVLFGLAILLSVKSTRWAPTLGFIIGVIFIYGAFAHPVGLRALPVGVILGVPTVSISALALQRR